LSLIFDNSSHFRKDAIGGSWVIISTERNNRPLDWHVQLRKNKQVMCPFCPGNEQVTPNEIAAIRKKSTAPNTEGWQLRVIPNKFPALLTDGKADHATDGIYETVGGIGAHEIIIETPNHNEELSQLSVAKLQAVLRMIAKRIMEIKQDSRLKYVLVFKNFGHAAGASLEHSHIQIIGTPILPKRIAEEIEGITSYYGKTGRCIFCEIISKELSLTERLVLSNKNYVVVEPFASRFAFETWIMPIEHRQYFENITRAESLALAKIFKETLSRINVAVKKPSYNLVIHTSPISEHEGTLFHWHIEIMPKLGNMAGFEWGSGFHINPISPENAAKLLREVRC